MAIPRFFRPLTRHPVSPITRPFAGRRPVLAEPRLVTDESRALLPRLVRVILRLAGVHEFIVMREVTRT